MNSFAKKLMGLMILFFLCSKPVCAQEIMAILSDNLRPVSTNYMIYPETSNLISQEISNLINLNNNIKALPVCNSISNSQKQALDKDLIRFAKEYEYTYTLNYDILRKISTKLGASYILLVTTGIDIETNFLKETIWSKIPISGENSVNPSYRDITQITLLDPVNELILLQKNYDSDLSSKNFDLAMPTFSTSPIQVQKFHKHSISIAKNVTPIIEGKIIPELMPQPQTFIEKVKFKKNKLNEEVQLNLVNKKPSEPSNDIIIKPNPNLKLFNYVEDDL